MRTERSISTLSTRTNATTKTRRHEKEKIFFVFSFVVSCFRGHGADQRPAMSIPHDLIGRQHGPRETGPDVMKPAVLVAHRDDAAVAAAEAAPHDSLHRHLTRPAVSHRGGANHG